MRNHHTHGNGNENFNSSNTWPLRAFSPSGPISPGERLPSKNSDTYFNSTNCFGTPWPRPFLRMRSLSKKKLGPGEIVPPSLGVTLLRHPLCTILMHITQFNTIYILSTITQITRSIRMSLYADMCCTFSGGWIDLFVCFCVFVEMHMFLYVYKIAHSLVVWLIWLFVCVCLLLSF